MEPQARSRASSTRYGAMRGGLVARREPGLRLRSIRATGLFRLLDDLRQERLRTLIMALAVLVVGWLVLYPLGILFEIGLHAEDGSFTLANYARVFTEPGLVSALVNSI